MTNLYFPNFRYYFPLINKYKGYSDLSSIALFKF